MAEVKTVSFYTTGEGLTDTIRDFIQSGSFYNAIEILKDGGFNKEQILTFMLGKYRFEGDTRKGDLDVLTDVNDIGYSLIITGWKTLMTQPEFKKYEPYDFDQLEKLSLTDRHLKSLTSIFPLTFLKNLLAKPLLKASGYKLYDKPPLHIIESGSGVIIQDGTFIEVGYQEHQYLYPILYKLGLSSSSEWTKDEMVIHVSSGQLHGAVAHSIESYRELREATPTPEQLEAVFNWREHFPSFYGFGVREVGDAVRKYIIKETGKGAKYGNLLFLKKFYKFNVPEISLEPMDKKYCIRTSPNKSIAGLLHSKFDITEDSEKEIWADWEKYKDVVKGNKLSLFYQEYLDGANGVAHYYKKGVFSYAVGENRGDIVNGKSSVALLSIENFTKLREICRTLHKDLGKQIQLEFVLTEDDALWVVQLRVLETPDQDYLNPDTFKDVLAFGKSFTAGDVTCDLGEVLIVEEDSPSEALLGKKALIVKKDMEFSHILALSQSLGIPSIFGVDFNFKGDLPKKLRIVTTSISGIICKAE